MVLKFLYRILSILLRTNFSRYLFRPESPCRHPQSFVNRRSMRFAFATVFGGISASVDLFAVVVFRTRSEFREVSPAESLIFDGSGAQFRCSAYFFTWMGLLFIASYMNVIGLEQNALLARYISGFRDPGICCHLFILGRGWWWWRGALFFYVDTFFYELHG